MRVLVLSASKHGSTAEIAQVISDTIAEHGIETVAMDVDDIYEIDAYDAVVLGSSVYAGHWLKSALQFVDSHIKSLTKRPVWLFSSGPISNQSRARNERSVDVSSITAKIKPRDHWAFAGKLDKSKFSFSERAMILALHAPEGDYRNWNEIRAWAHSIARQLDRELP